MSNLMFCIFSDKCLWPLRLFRIGTNLGGLLGRFYCRTFLAMTFLLAPKQVLYHPGPEQPSKGQFLVSLEPSLGPIGFLLILPHIHAAAGFNGPCDVPLKPLVLHLTFKPTLSFVCFAMWMNVQPLVCWLAHLHYSWRWLTPISMIFRWAVGAIIG